MNNIFGIKNIEFNSGFKKIIKYSAFGSKVAIVVFNGRRLQRRPLAKF